MAAQATAIHVARIRSGYTDRHGQRREYASAHLRRTYRDGGKIRHESLPGLPGTTVDSIETALKGTAPMPAAAAARITRVVAPAAKLSALAWWADTTLSADLGAAEAFPGRIYAAMDWLARRQDAIEARPARRYLGSQANPARIALFDLSSSLVQGQCWRSRSSRPTTARCSCPCSMGGSGRG